MNLKGYIVEFIIELQGLIKLMGHAQFILWLGILLGNDYEYQEWAV